MIIVTILAVLLGLVPSTSTTTTTSTGTTVAPATCINPATCDSNGGPGN